MPATAKAPIESFVMLKPEQIGTSPFNPRKHFDQSALMELADDIQVHGIIEPLIVRPNPTYYVSEDLSQQARAWRVWSGPLSFEKKNNTDVSGRLLSKAAAEKLSAQLNACEYELIAGERRLRAARIAKLEEAPVRVLQLTDREADEIRLIENLQRQDLTAVEEADGFEMLMKKHDLAPADLARKIGKSVRHVYQRLQLVELCEAVREAILSGKLQPTMATLVARIPDEKTQAKYLKEILHQGYNGETMTFRTAARMLNEGYQVSLGTAQFSTKDPSLVPSAGSCSQCAKNSTNFPKEMEASANVCTDLACFRAKSDAHFNDLVQIAKANGSKVLAPADVKRLFWRDNLNHGSGYVDLDKPCEEDSKRRPWKKVLGSEAPPPVIARAETGRIHHLLPEKVAKEAAKKAGLKVNTSTPAKSEYQAKHEREQKARRERDRIMSEAARRSITEIVETIEAGPLVANYLPALRVAIKALIGQSWSEAVKEVIRRRKLFKDRAELEKLKNSWESARKERDLFRETVEVMSGEQLLALLLELVVTRGAYYDGKYGKTLVVAADTFGVQISAHEGVVRAEIERKRRITRRPARLGRLQGTENATPTLSTLDDLLLKYEGRELWAKDMEGFSDLGIPAELWQQARKEKLVVLTELGSYRITRTGKARLKKLLEAKNQTCRCEVKECLVVN